MLQKDVPQAHWICRSIKQILWSSHSTRYLYIKPLRLPIDSEYRHKYGIICCAQLFGYPTGLGALIVRNGNQLSLILSNPYYYVITVIICILHASADLRRETIYH